MQKDFLSITLTETERGTMTTPTGPTIDHSSYIGASDIGALAGQSPYRTALDVWAAKTGKAPGFAGNIHTEIGNAFERPALEIYSKIRPADLKFPGTLIHPEKPWAGATPDAIANDRLVVECKIVGWNTARQWGGTEEGADGVPAAVLCQVHWQSWIARSLNIAPCEMAEVAAVHGTKMQIYEIPINESFVSDLVEIGEMFWNDNVIKNKMPMIEGDSANDIIAAIHPKHLKEDLLPMTDGIRTLALKYEGARAVEKEATEFKETLGAQLKAMIGDNAGYIDEDGFKATWKTSKGRISWKSVAEAAGKRLDHHIYNMIKKDNTSKIGSRLLNVFNGKKK